MASQGIGVEVFGRTDIGKVRRNNEDAFVIADLMTPETIHAMARPLAMTIGDRGVLLAVSDGIGGARAGEVASALALHSLRRGMNAGHASGAEAALQASVEKANDKVWNAAATSEQVGMGATLTAVLIHDRRAYIAEVGDSRAYVLRGHRFVQLTHDQSYVQLLLDNGSLTREQAETFPYKNVILQAIGLKPAVFVALTRFALRRGDRLLLCSDGLSGKVSDDEMKDIASSISALDAVCAQLINLANARGGEDNITVVLADVEGDGIPVLADHEGVSLESVR